MQNNRLFKIFFYFLLIYINCSPCHFLIAESKQIDSNLSLLTQNALQHSSSTILGSTNLFVYDQHNHSIGCSTAFNQLLALLVSIEMLDAQVLIARNVFELNTVLQKKQGLHGGLLRTPGTERWEMCDPAVLKENEEQLRSLFTQLGLSSDNNVPVPKDIQHCFVFGGRVERMEIRIKKTLEYVQLHGIDVEHFLLLGSSRKLIAEEIQSLYSKINALESSKKEYWELVFNDSENLNEANAILFLWESLISPKLLEKYRSKVIAVSSKNFGDSHPNVAPYRPTTDVTTDDWMSYYKNDVPQNILAVIEQPYIRLGDQLYLSILTNKKTASKEMFLYRLNNTHFYFPVCAPDVLPLLSIVLDEIARNVYRTVETLKYTESH